MNQTTDNKHKSKKPPRFVSRKEFEDVKLDAKNANTAINYSLVCFAQIDGRLRSVEDEKRKLLVSATICVVCLALSTIVFIATFFCALTILV